MTEMENMELSENQNELLDEMELTGFQFDFSLLSGIEPNYNFELELN